MVYGLTGAGSGDIGQGNLFKPGTFTGQNPVFKQYDNSNPAYKTDWNNVAPSIGAAWRPALGNKWLAMLLGDEPVIRGGYSMSFTKAATDFFNGIYGDQPGADAGRAAAGSPRARRPSGSMGSRCSCAKPIV